MNAIKIILMLVLVISITDIWAQPVNTGLIKFEVLCFTKDARQDQKNIALMKVVNMTDSTLTMPLHLEAYFYDAQKLNTDITYEIVKLSGKDTGNIYNALSVVDISYLPSFNKEFSLKKGDEQIIEHDIPTYLLNESGDYKIRFILNVSKFIVGFPEVKTSWMYFNYKKDLSN